MFGEEKQSDCFLKVSDMQQEEKKVLQVTKAIVIKFIEVGRIAFANFYEVFSKIFYEFFQAVMSNKKDLGDENRVENCRTF